MKTFQMYRGVIVLDGGGPMGRKLERTTDLALKALGSKLGAWDLRPHFLLNALHSIDSLIRKGETEDALTLLSALGRMLQRSLELEGGDVELADEAVFADHYLRVERVRFGREIFCEIHIPRGLGSALVPSFALQPLIEDVVRNSVRGDETSTRLAIGARRVGACLELEVRATAGDGSSPPAGAVDGFGVSELSSRLDARYASSHRAAFVSDPRGAGIARLRIPLRYWAAGEAIRSLGATGC